MSIPRFMDQEYVDLDDEMLDDFAPDTDELDADISAHAREYKVLYDSLPDRAKIQYLIQRCMIRIRRWREIIKRVDLPFYRDCLRKSQIELLRLRTWRTTGVRPRDA